MKFLTKNYVEDFDSITASTGSTVANVYDRDFSTVWTSVGSDDTTTETIEVIWASEQTFDRIAMLNHNCKDFNIQYWNGAAYVDFSTPIDVTGGSATDNLWTFTELSTLKIKLSATKTIAANAEKTIGQFMAYDEYFDIDDNDKPYFEDRDSYFREFSHELADGGTVLVTEVTAGKYWNIFTWEALPETERNLIETLKELHVAFWLIPDDDDVSLQYYVVMPGFKFNKVPFWKVTTNERCYNGSIVVKET